jgi:hypothetical protein
MKRKDFLEAIMGLVFGFIGMSVVVGGIIFWIAKLLGYHFIK